MRFSRLTSCLSRALPGFPSAYGAPTWCMESMNGCPHCSQRPPATRRRTFVTFFQLDGYLSLLTLMTVISQGPGPLLIELTRHYFFETIRVLIDPGCERARSSHCVKSSASG